LSKKGVWEAEELGELGELGEQDNTPVAGFFSC